MSCKKCGGCYVSGPRYRRDATCNEALHYTCVTCGFSWSTPTVDKREHRANEETLKRLQQAAEKETKR